MTHQNSIPFFANKILPKKQMLQRCLQRYFKSPFSSISHKKASILARVDIEPVFLVLQVWLLLKFYDCLVFSQIINSYPLVAVFEFLVVRMISIQFFCWHFVENRRLLQGTAAGDIFCPYFSDATLLPALLQKRSEMFMLFLLGLRAIHININKDSKLSTKGYF